MSAKTDIVHIRLSKEGNWPPFDSEEVSAVQEGDHEFRISSTPAFAKRLAVGDVVRVAHYGASQVLWLEAMVSRGGHSTVRVIVRQAAGEDVERELADGISVRGCEVLPTPLQGLFSIDIPPNVAYAPIKNFLDNGLDRGIWEYEEAAISAEHARET